MVVEMYAVGMQALEEQRTRNRRTGSGLKGDARPKSGIKLVHRQQTTLKTTRYNHVG